MDPSTSSGQAIDNGIEKVVKSGEKFIETEGFF